MPQHSSTEDVTDSLPTSDELIQLFADVLPEDVLEGLRELELDPLVTYSALWAELVDHGIDPEAAFMSHGLLEPEDQMQVLLDNPQEAHHD